MCDCVKNGITNCTCEDNCPTRTSDIATFNGTFSNISVPDGASLNDVLLLMEQYINNQVNTVNVTSYTLAADSACLGLSAGTYSHTQMIEAIVAVLCSSLSDISDIQTTLAALEALNTTNVDLDGIVLPSCFSAFAGTTSTDLFNEILTELCGLLSDVGPDAGGDVTVVNPDVGQTIDPDTPSYTSKELTATYGALSEVINAIADNPDFIYEHTSPSSSSTSFTVQLQPMKGVVSNYIVIRGSAENFTVNATVDTYFFLSGDGTILKREVAVGATAPATPSGSHNLYKIESDGSGVVGITNLYETDAMGAISLGIGSVLTANIKDANVTSAKLAPVTTTGTIGDASLIRFRVNDQGQVISYASNLNVAGVSNGQILIYNSATNAFESGDNTAVSSSNNIPKANSAGTDYEDSSLTEVTNQVQSVKKVEINEGVMEDDSEALLNLASTSKYFLPPRMTAAQAGALTPTDGALIYVTTTDATFTSVGFWGVESGAWTKL
jgi:hypothetical protein